MSWYDRAEIYDALFSWDPKDEREFVLAASARWGIPEPRRVLEPFCGSGRLLRVMPGVAVGVDLNPHMLRLALGRGRVLRADASRFAFRPGCFDLAYCLIDSFRHLLTEKHAFDHLRCVAAALAPGAVYVLGFEVTGDLPAPPSADEWEQGGVHGYVIGLGDADPDSRIETAHFRMTRGADVIESFQPLRTYTARQVEDLVDDEGSFEIAATFDRAYEIDCPVEVSELRGSAVLILQKIC